MRMMGEAGRRRAPGAAAQRAAARASVRDPQTAVAIPQ